MFKKPHIQLTILSTVITGMIVIVMTYFLSYVSENNLSKNEYLNFITSINSIHSYLKTQTTITTEWLAETENNGKFILYIEDNGVPIKYRNDDLEDKRGHLINEVKATAISEHDLNISDTDTSKVVAKQVDFNGYDSNKLKYYASVAYIPKGNGYLGVIAIYPLELYQRNILIQRFIYIGIDIATIVFLWFFSYFFTKRILKPIEENRKKQVDFIALASHELRSPLTVITSSISGMKKQMQSKVLGLQI